MSYKSDLDANIRRITAGIDPPPLMHTVEQMERAYDEWGCNCGPGALCAILGLTPDEVRPHLEGFDRKRYTNPTMMWAALESLGVQYDKDVLGRRDPGTLALPSFGIARVQWSGPWCEEGRPARAAYRHTHWIAAIAACRPVAIFDVNNPGSWVSVGSWTEIIVPWLLKGCEPKADGTFWYTHSVEIAHP